MSADKLAACAEHGTASEVLQALRQALAGPPDYPGQVSTRRAVKTALGNPLVRQALYPVKIAILGSSTTSALVALLELHLVKEGLLPEIYEAPFGQIQQQVLDPGSALYAFQPKVVLFDVHYRDAQLGPIEDELERWKSLWAQVSRRAKAVVIMNNFDIPVERPLGNLESKSPDSRLGRLRRLNVALAEQAPSGVVILDQDHLSSVLGKERWHDPRFWHQARQAVALAALPLYAAEAACLVKAILGRSRKCLVVDLDNTLWGGVVGDDGVEAIKVGQTPEGEAFLDFQRYLKALKERGVLLAVCSKNDDSAAREPFLKRPEMALRLEDFAAFVANWNDKAANMRTIAQSLNVGLEALAFVDDSPAERERVRAACPEVAVVDLPQDPALFVSALDSSRLFETVAISQEDLLRTAHFQAEQLRRGLEAESASLDSFLRGLQMEASVEPFHERDIPRIAQLIQKTNQFNLTGLRYTEPEIRTLLDDPRACALSVRLKDRFGDYGLISAAVARRDGSSLLIDLWLMSCRVLGRGVEDLLFSHLISAARAMKVSLLIGEYRPSSRNGLVKDHYRRLGFRPDSAGRWLLDVDRAEPKATFIKEAAPNEVS